MSMRDAARRIGVPETTYREWEYGRQIRGAESYKRIARAFGVSLAELFGEESNELTIEQRLNRASEDIQFVRASLNVEKK